MTKSWKNVPKIINTLPTDKDTLIMYVDESGEGNNKILKKSFEAKKEKIPYSQRNDLYLLNGVVLSGFDSIILKNRLDKLKLSIADNGIFNYEKKGERPIVLRNHEIVSKNPPFSNLKENQYEQINRIIKNTNYIQIAAGLNYYIYTQFNKDSESSSSPLLMTLGLLLINYADYLNSTNKKGIIIFEEETEKHDKLKYILKILNYGNKTYNKEFFSKITAVYFRKKWTEEKKGEYQTTAGLELADLTISPLRRMLHPEFLLIERKLYNYPNYINKGFNIIT